MGFHPKWVAPFYLKLMNANFLRMEPEKQHLFAKSLQNVLSEIDSLTLNRMLADQNWRPRLTAGWFIGFGRMKAFTDSVGESLITFPHYAGMYCFALAHINNEGAVQHLQRYLSTYLTPEKAQDSQAETLSVSYGLVALQQVSQEHANAFYPDRWNRFVEANLDFYSGDLPLFQGIRNGLRKHWTLEHIGTEFTRWNDFAEQHFG